MNGLSRESLRRFNEVYRELTEKELLLNLTHALFVRAEQHYTWFLEKNKCF